MFGGGPRKCRHSERLCVRVLKVEGGGGQCVCDSAGDRVTVVCGRSVLSADWPRAATPPPPLRSALLVLGPN